MIYKFLKKYALYQKTSTDKIKGRIITYDRIYFIFWAITENRNAFVCAFTAGNFVEGLDKVPKNKTLNKKELLEKTWNNLEKTLKKGLVEIGGKKVKAIAIGIGEIPNEFKDVLVPYFPESYK